MITKCFCFCLVGIYAITSYNIKEGTKIEVDGAPWRVLAFVRIKLQNNMTGTTVERTFRNNLDERFMLMHFVDAGKGKLLCLHRSYQLDQLGNHEAVAVLISKMPCTRPDTS